jgi:hypothetical protein
MKKPAQKPLILSAYARGDHLDLFTVMEERKEVRTQMWERMGPGLTASRKEMSGRIGTDTGKFQTTILCVDSSRCLVQALGFPTSDVKELNAMAASSLSFLPVLTQPEYVNSYSVLERGAQGSLILSVTFRKDELIPLLEKVEKWGADFPLVVPDAWVVWKHTMLNLKLPDEYVWVWIDSAADEKKVALKIFVVRGGQPRFVFQPFVPAGGDRELAASTAAAVRMALACAAREKKGPIQEAPVYFSSYRMNLAGLLGPLSLDGRPIGQLALHVPPQECAASLQQVDPGGFKNWLPDFWKSYQTGRSKVRRRIAILKTAGAAYLVLLAGLLGLHLWQKHAIDREQAAIEVRQPAYEQAVGLKKQAARMRTQAEGNQNALDVLYVTTMAMPREVTLTGYGFKFQDGLSLRGFAPSNAAVYDFVEALKKQKPFRLVELNSVRNNPLKNWVEFDIQCKLGVTPGSGGAGS